MLRPGPARVIAGPDENLPGADYTDEERVFLMAMERYKRERRRPYPTWREVLRVFLSLGYRKVAEPQPPKPPPDSPLSPASGERGGGEGGETSPVRSA